MGLANQLLERNKPPVELLAQIKQLHKDRLDQIYAKDLALSEDEISDEMGQLGIELGSVVAWANDEIKTRYKDFIKLKKSREIQGWRLFNDIEKNLSKTLWEKVRAYIERNTMDYDVAIAICKKYKIPEFKEGSPYVLYRPNYDDLQEELERSRIQCKKYIGVFKEYPRVKVVVKHSNHGAAILAVGYYSYFPDKVTGRSTPRRNYFWSETNEGREYLKNLNVG